MATKPRRECSLCGARSDRLRGRIRFNYWVSAALSGDPLVEREMLCPRCARKERRMTAVFLILAGAIAIGLIVMTIVVIP